jgi:hypothetical protein
VSTRLKRRVVDTYCIPSHPGISLARASSSSYILRVTLFDLKDRLCPSRTRHTPSKRPSSGVVTTGDTGGEGGGDRGRGSTACSISAGLVTESSVALSSEGRVLLGGVGRGELRWRASAPIRGAMFLESDFNSDTELDKVKELE